MFTFTTVLSSMGLTIVLAAVSFYYYTKGKQAGMVEAMQIVQEFEPKAFNRIHTKLRKVLDA